MEEFLEALGSMHYWEKQRNDVMFWIDVCITTAMFFGFNRRIFSEHIFPGRLDHSALELAALFILIATDNPDKISELFYGQSDVS